MFSNPNGKEDDAEEFSSSFWCSKFSSGGLLLCSGKEDSSQYDPDITSEKRRYSQRQSFHEGEEEAAKGDWSNTIVINDDEQRDDENTTTTKENIKNKEVAPETENLGNKRTSIVVVDEQKNEKFYLLDSVNHLLASSISSTNEKTEENTSSDVASNLLQMQPSTGTDCTNSEVLQLKPSTNSEHRYWLGEGLGQTYGCARSSSSMNISSNSINKRTTSFASSLLQPSISEYNYWNNTFQKSKSNCSELIAENKSEEKICASSVSKGNNRRISFASSLLQPSNSEFNYWTNAFQRSTFSTLSLKTNKDLPKEDDVEILSSSTTTTEVHHNLCDKELRQGASDSQSSTLTNENQVVEKYENVSSNSNKNNNKDPLLGMDTPVASSLGTAGTIRRKSILKSAKTSNNSSPTHTSSLKSKRNTTTTTGTTKSLKDKLLCDGEQQRQPM